MSDRNFRIVRIVMTVWIFRQLVICFYWYFADAIICWLGNAVNVLRRNRFFVCTDNVRFCFPWILW